MPKQKAEQMNQSPNTSPAVEIELDYAKLLGFRNLPLVTAPGTNPRTSADLAFTKRGIEGPA